MPVEVTRITQQGVWLAIGDRTLLLPFTQFPWFRHAPLDAVFRVELPEPGRLHWPDLDVDLDLDSLEQSDRSSPGCEPPGART